MSAVAGTALPIRHLRVAPAEAIAALAFLLSWHQGSEGAVPLFVNGRPVPSSEVHCTEAAGAVLALERRESAQVELGLPQVNGMVLSSPTLWCWSEGKQQLFELGQFRPEPTIVLRFGAASTRLALWGLDEELSWAEVERFNDRLASATHGARTRTRPEKLRVPLPGTFLRVGRSRPVPVLVTRMQSGTYTARQVVGKLKDAPTRDAWREKR